MLRSEPDLDRTSPLPADQPTLGGTETWILGLDLIGLLVAVILMQLAMAVSSAAILFRVPRASLVCCCLGTTRDVSRWQPRCNRSRWWSARCWLPSCSSAP